MVVGARKCWSSAKNVSQAMSTDRMFVVWRNVHILHTFLQTTAINNGSERKRNNLVCLRFRDQGQSVPSGFSLYF